MAKTDGKFSIADLGVIFAIIAGIFSGVAYMVHDTKVELKEDIEAVSQDVQEINYKLDTMTCKTQEDKDGKKERMAEEETYRKDNPEDNWTKEDESKLFWRYRLGKSYKKGEVYGVRP